MADERIRIVNRPDAGRYELLVNDVLAGVCEYNLVGDSVMFTHTEVFAGHEGMGLGSRLASFVLEDVKRQGKLVIPVCRYIAKYIGEHEEYKELVREDVRKAFKI